MTLSCPRCLRTLEYSSERPSFCAYCGVALAGSLPSTLEPEATVDFQHSPAPGYEASEESDRLPDFVGSYRLLRKLGQGGMGSVHEAEEEASGRRVAVKLIAPEFTASAQAVERFLQEGRLASAITHPRCVFVLAADQSNGWPYIVMELMPGHTLKDLVEDEGPLDQSLAVLKIMDVIEGLEEAHKLGVIHRDVKPSNCFLTADGRVKIGDFGLSKSLIEGDGNLTRSGSFLGTPYYASPEQIKGEEIDERSDVYSVAATLYFLLTGRPPHQANDPTVALARIVSEDAPPIRSIRAEVYSSLEDVVLRGLERDRRRRYRTLEEFREAIEPFLPGRVTLGRIGLRIAAYAVDKFLSLLLSIPIMEHTLHAHQGSRRGFIESELYTGLMVFAYYTIFEVLSVATPGKRLFRLRVISVKRGGWASWLEASLRILIFAALVIAPTRIYSCIIAPNARFQSMVGAGLIIQIMFVPLLFLTARASNGYRGLHEILSQTAVVSLPRRLRRRRGSRKRDTTRFDLRVSRPEEMPARLGSFQIDAALRWTPHCRLLLGEDEKLSRLVWIVLHPRGKETIPDVRRDVGRLARPRWLGSGECDDWSWNAFVAPQGHPLPEFVRTQGPLDWHAGREVLEALAEELDAAIDDGTMPSELAVERIWIQPDGRVVLIDPEIDPLSELSIAIDGNTHSLRAVELLRRVAVHTLSGVSPSRIDDQPRPVGAPVPGHAVKMVARLCRLESPYAAPCDFLRELARTREYVPTIWHGQRIGHAIYTLFASLVKTLVLPLAVFVATILATSLYYHVPIEWQEPWFAFMDVFIFQSALWVLLAILVGDGLSGLFFGVTVVRVDGRNVSPLRRGWREATRWLPTIAVGMLLQLLIPQHAATLPKLELIQIFATSVPLISTLHAVIWPGRYLQDRLAGTAVVPR